MAWTASYFNEADIEVLRSALNGAAAKTSVVIKPLLVRQSISSTGGAGAKLALLLVFFLLLIDPESFWRGDQYWSLYINEISFILLLGIAKYLSKLPVISRLFIANSYLEKAAFDRAQLEFYEADLGSDAEPGILIMMSHLERRVVILAEERISDHLGKDFMHHLAQELKLAVKKGQLGNGMADVIRSTGSQLAPFMPAFAGKPRGVSQIIMKL